MCCLSLRTMLAPIIFAPKSDVAAKARGRAHELAAQNRDCVAVDVRWTDKRQDRGVSASVAHTINHIPAARDRLNHRTGRSFRCLLLLSDDEVFAKKALVRQLRDTYHIKAVSRLRGMFKSEKEYNKYRKIGHTYFEREVAMRDPERSYAYSQAVVVDILTASLAAELAAVACRKFWPNTWELSATSTQMRWRSGKNV